MPTKPIAYATIRLSLLVKGLNELTNAAGKESSRNYIGTTKSKDFLFKDFENQLLKGIEKANGNLHYRDGAVELVKSLTDQATGIYIITQISSKCVDALFAKIGRLANGGDVNLIDRKQVVSPIDSQDVSDLYKEIFYRAPATSGVESSLGLAFEYQYPCIAPARQSGMLPIIYLGMSSNPAFFADYVKEAGAVYTSSCLRDLSDKVNNPAGIITSGACISAAQPV